MRQTDGRTEFLHKYCKSLMTGDKNYKAKDDMFSPWYSQQSWVMSVIQELHDHLFDLQIHFVDHQTYLFDLHIYLFALHVHLFDLHVHPSDFYIHHFDLQIFLFDL